MKVLHITNAYPNEQNTVYGIFIKEQIESLKKIGLECEVLFINAKYKSKWQYFTMVNKIKAAAKQFDIIHCHHAYSAFVTIYLARVNKPLIVSLLNARGGEGNHRFLSTILYDLLVSNKTHLIIKDDPTIELKYPGNTYYIPNGVDTELFREIDKITAFEAMGLAPNKYILFASTGYIERPQKRYDIFQETINIVNTKYGINVKELLLCNIKREDVPYYFNASSLHLLTSDYEGSPNSVKEALACNIPVVCTDVGNVRHMLNGIDGCYVVNSNNPQELADYVVKALAKDRINGRDAIVSKGLDMQSTAYRIKNIYNALLEDNK